MKFIGIDSAALSGYAFIGCSGAPDYTPNSWVCGTCRADSPMKYDVLAHAKENGVTHACIEAPMPFTGSHAGVASSMNRSYGRWLEACDTAGIIVVPCLVSQWQASMLVVNGKRIKQDKLKAGSYIVAQLLGASVLNGDEADAVCIASFGPQAVALNEAKAVEKKAVARAKAKGRS